MKILNVEWINNIGIVTIDTGTEIKTYIKSVKGFNEKVDTQDVIDWGYRLYPELLEKILKLHKKE